MRPRTFRLRIFIALWIIYIGSNFISLISKKIAAEQYKELMADISTQPEITNAQENYLNLLRDNSPSAGEIPNLMKEVKSIELKRGAFKYALLSAWFYLFSWLIFLLFKKVRLNA